MAVQYNFGIIGAGDIVRKSYIPELKSRSDCNIAWIYSPGGRSANELADRHNIKGRGDNLKGLLASKRADAIIIAIPPSEHIPILTEVFHHSVHILVEKPLSVDIQKCRQILQMAEKHRRENDKIFCVAFNNFFRPENQYLLESVQSNKIGRIQWVRLEWLRKVRSETKTWIYKRSRAGGGVMMDLGTHLLHLALKMIPDRVAFQGYMQQKTYDDKISMEDSESLIERVEDFAMAQIRIERHSGNEPVFLSVVTGWSFMMQESVKVNVDIAGNIGTVSNKDYTGGKHNGYRAMLNDFIFRMKNTEMPDMKATLHVMQIIDALYQSAGSRLIAEEKFL